jgi:hypothetical protein
MTRAPIALAAIFIAGCYDAPRPECGFRCGPSAACPADYTCASDNTCHANGASPDLVCATPDAGMVTPDAYSPRIIFMDPAPDEMVPDTTTSIEVGFDVDVVGVGNTTFTVKSMMSPLTGTVTYVPSTRRATFSVSRGLPANADLSIHLSEAIVNRAPNALMPTMYTIHIGPDTTPPTVKSLAPLDGATGVSVKLLMRFKFSEAVLHADDASINLLDGATPVDATVYQDDEAAETLLSPREQLLPNHTYTGRVTTAVTDRAGNPLATTYTTTFTTGPDTEPPYFRSLMPGYDAVNVPVTANIVITFDEPALNVDTTSFQVQVNGGAVAGTVTMSNGNKTATFDPAASLPAASEVTVTLTSAITDMFGNARTPTDYYFTTM